MTQIVYVEATGPALGAERDATDLIGQTFGAGISAVAIPAERLDPAFFDLSSGVAGAFMQKFATYRVRLVVLGDITEHLARSRALRDFVRESNAGTQVWFLPGRAELESKLART